LETNFWPERNHDITNAAFEIKEDISVFFKFIFDRRKTVLHQHTITFLVVISIIFAALFVFIVVGQASFFITNAKNKIIAYP